MGTLDNEERFLRTTETLEAISCSSADVDSTATSVSNKDTLAVLGIIFDDEI